MTELGRFEDDRGVIQDLLGKVDAVTEIRTCKGKIRGNHYHLKTTQWTYVVSGRMRIVISEVGGAACKDTTYGPGEVACEEPGTVHAWEALEDTVVLVFTRGPRAGKDYESDTYRVAGADKLL